MRDCKICRIYSDVQDKVTSVIFAKQIAEEERKRKLTVMIVLISVGVAVVAAVAAAAIYLAAKTEEGERRGKILVNKIKEKMPKLPKKACECECAEEACECAEEACECVEEACECECAEETVEE